MSRVLRYKDSIERFINDRDCFENLRELNILEKFENEFYNEDYIFSIVMLTIMNNRTKKNKLSYQGYYIAVSVDCLRVIYENKEKQIENINDNMLLTSMKLWNNNILSIKKKVPTEKVNKMILHFNDAISRNIFNIYKKNSFVFERENKTDLHRSVLKRHSKKIEDKYSNLKLITKESLDEYILNTTCKVSEIAFILGWVSGCGSEPGILKMKKLAELFGYIYKISYDFKNLHDDIEELNQKYSLNYVINRGIQESYEMFLKKKELFIEESMKIDALSSTIMEIVNILENNVSDFIDDTTPDFKTSYSVLNC